MTNKVMMNKFSLSLKDRLFDWKDWDLAAYELGACLGLWKEFGESPGQDPWNSVKGIMWSSNPLGEVLHTFLLGLVKEGMLEYSEEDQKFRWNANYKLPL